MAFDFSALSGALTKIQSDTERFKKNAVAQQVQQAQIANSAPPGFQVQFAPDGSAAFNFVGVNDPRIQTQLQQQQALADQQFQQRLALARETAATESQFRRQSADEQFERQVQLQKLQNENQRTRQLESFAFSEFAKVTQDPAFQFLSPTARAARLSTVQSAIGAVPEGSPVRLALEGSLGVQGLQQFGGQQFNAATLAQLSSGAAGASIPSAPQTPQEAPQAVPQLTDDPVVSRVLSTLPGPLDPNLVAQAVSQGGDPQNPADVEAFLVNRGLAQPQQFQLERDRLGQAVTNEELKQRLGNASTIFLSDKIGRAAQARSIQSPIIVEVGDDGVPAVADVALEANGRFVEGEAILEALEEQVTDLQASNPKQVQDVITATLANTGLSKMRSKLGSILRTFGGRVEGDTLTLRPDGGTILNVRGGLHVLADRPGLGGATGTAVTRLAGAAHSGLSGLLRGDLSVAQGAAERGIIEGGPNLDERGLQNFAKLFRLINLNFDLNKVRVIDPHKTKSSDRSFELDLN